MTWVQGSRVAAAVADLLEAAGLVFTEAESAALLNSEVTCADHRQLGLYVASALGAAVRTALMDGREPAECPVVGGLVQAVLGLRHAGPDGRRG